MAMDDGLLIGELAVLCGVSTDTIRHYESIGVIAPAAREGNGYRRFPRSAADRIRVIRRAIAIGFSLDEIARIFRRRESGSAPCREVRALAGEKLDDLQRRIEELTSLRDELEAVIESWDERLSATREGEPAFLLESLTPSSPRESSRREKNEKESDHRRSVSQLRRARR
jgi:DNA-binding transcriptional MerR regulator